MLILRDELSKLLIIKNSRGHNTAIKKLNKK